MPANLTLVSHALCPYVQRIAIALAEKGVAFDRRTVDLARKPDWFLAISPLGRTPVLMVADTALFELVAVLEYLEDALPIPLHPQDPIERARHRAWIGFAVECLNEISRLYSALDVSTLECAAAALHARFRVPNGQLGDGPWFGGLKFGLADAVYAPVFRYFDTFDTIRDFGVFDGLEKVCAWRKALGARPSVRAAIAADYSARLTTFVKDRDGALAACIVAQFA